MPKIRSYDSPQQQASGRGLNETGDARFAGDVARSQQQLIGSATGLADVIYKRQAQSEVSDLNASFAKAREDWTTNLNEQVRKGTVDVESLRTDYTDYMDKLSGDVNTPEARDFFDKQSTRLRGSLMKAAVRGQAAVAGAKAVTSYTEALNSSSNTLNQNPADFQDIYDSQVEGLDAQIKSGAIDFQTAQKLKEDTGAQLAQSSLRGYAQQNPDMAEQALHSGQYDKLINETTRNQMQGFINQQRMGKDLEQRRAEAAEEKAKKLAGEAWEQKNVKSLMTGSLPTDAIFKSPLSAEQQIQWVKLQKAAIADTLDTNPAVYNDLVKRTLLPDDDPNKIRSFGDLAPYVGKSGINIQDADKINGFIQKLPSGENLRDNRKRLFEFAEQKISKKNAMMGIVDPDGEMNLARFQQALQSEEARMREEKKNPALLYDPNSKEYFGNQVSKYQSTPQEIMARMAGSMQRKATGPGVSQETGPAPSPAQSTQAPAKDSKTRKPGESAADFLERMGLGK